MENKEYTREEKIAYYAKRVAVLEASLKRITKMLDYANNRLAKLVNPDIYVKDVVPGDGGEPR